ncbi:putative amidoligase enzyme-domain-containing protein [Xylaria bambusicola]|uniref:putative amidoligase enzyme-domain-containing protein n=1 Tax=Xylaria bambusicola TaxID=326684 RepID=UPI002008B005|nr:putative amidoligase enzyme-domain-containing protein [Xylaria bambusicola]KAI0518126.1 putative amidoligase enzyme-domain-containing protein [Xylaria bambusicola]
MKFIPKIDEIIEAQDDSTGTLTCGVELEFLLPSIDHMAKDPEPDIANRLLYRSTSRNPEIIHKEIREQLMAILRQLEGVSFRAMDDDDFHPPHDNVVVYDSWRLGSDTTVNKNHEDNECSQSSYTWTGCVLTSPVMNPHDHAANIDSICRILKIVRIHLNKSTSVHVHVGRGDEPFSLLTVRKFVTLYWLTEEAIFGLHHPSRKTNRHCLPLSKYSVIAKQLQSTVDSEDRCSNDQGHRFKDYVSEAGLSPLRRTQLRRIWACCSIEEVAKLMCIGIDMGWKLPGPDERGAVGFWRFLPAGKSGGNIQTFEWRQMSGSVDSNHINQWVKACIAFTDFCRLSDKGTFKKFVGKVIEKGDSYTGIELLNALDVDSHIFHVMRGAWALSRHFCNDEHGKDLFLPIDEL